jgi:hypothetical protein
MRWPQRYSRVPWLGPWDLEPAGLPEDIIRGEDVLTNVIRIAAPFGKAPDIFPVIVADKAQKTVTAHLRDAGDI